MVIVLHLSILIRTLALQEIYIRLREYFIKST